MEKPHQNTFTLLRIAAAFLVFYGHGYILFGKPGPDSILFHAVSPGALGVSIFFSISGYLIAASWDRDGNAWRFFLKRALRIFPALIVVVGISVFCLGFALTTLEAKKYFLNGDTFKYLLNIPLKAHFSLPGVFEHNPYPNVINGSLWSLFPEALMYVLIFVAGIFEKSLVFTCSMTLIFFFGWYFWASKLAEPIVFWGTDVKYIFMYGCYFWMGALLWRTRFLALLTSKKGSLPLIACVFFYALIFNASILPFVLPVFIISIALINIRYTRIINANDISYGIYLYAFPVQQTVIYLYPAIPFSLYMLLCAGCIVICSLISWHLLEKKVLRLKPKKK